RRPGAAGALIPSDKAWARIPPPDEPARLQDLIAQLRPVDVVLVEGFKQLEGLRRVEVFRGGGEPLVLTDPGIAAVAVPAGLEIKGFQGTTLLLDDIEAVLNF